MMVYGKISYSRTLSCHYIESFISNTAQLTMECLDGAQKSLGHIFYLGYVQKSRQNIVLINLPQDFRVRRSNLCGTALITFCPQNWGQNVVCIKCGSMLAGIYTHKFDLYRARLIVVKL